jgi:hypothetical protein
MKFRKTALAVAFLSLFFASANSPPTTEKPLSPESSCGMWESPNGKICMDLRRTPNGKYDAVVVWVSADADETVRSKLGEPLATGFSWDANSFAFVGGTMTVRTGGTTVTLACALTPDGENSLVMTAKKGLLSKKTEWKRC